MDLITPLHFPNCRVKAGKMFFIDKDGHNQIADVWIHVETGDDIETLSRNMDATGEQLMEIMDILEEQGCTGVRYEEEICPFEYPITPDIFTCVMEENEIRSSVL